MALDQLDSIRSTVLDCRVAALADLSSGLTLSVSSTEKMLQEQLDRYSEMAVQVLNGAIGDVVAGAFPDPEFERMQEGFVLMKAETCLFFRSVQDPQEAVICIFAKGIDLSGSLEKIRLVLQRT